MKPLMIARAPGHSSSRTSPDYLGTELLRDAYIPGNYLTIDRWTSEEAFRAFRKNHDSEYEVLDRQCDALTSRETRVGAYTVLRRKHMLFEDEKVFAELCAGHMRPRSNVT